MNYREKIREYIECPQFGNINYGKWGTLNIEQRKLIKKLLDEMDRADEYIKTLYFKNENLQSKIDKARKIIDRYSRVVDYDDEVSIDVLYEIDDVLKEVENVKNN